MNKTFTNWLLDITRLKKSTDSDMFKRVHKVEKDPTLRKVGAFLLISVNLFAYFSIIY